MNMRRLPFIGFIASLLCMWSCSEEMVGPSIDGIAIDTFNIVPTGNAKTIDADFAQGDSIHFMGSWEFDTKWIITVKGQQSGATKTLKGNGKSVDETIAWDGSSDLIFFRDGETCEATLSFEYYNDSLVADNFVHVVSTKPIEGIVLGDYDEIDAEGWGSTSRVVEDGVELPATQKRTFADEGILVPQGDNYLQISGYEDGGKYYLSGNILTISEAPLKIDTKNIGSNYINFFLYGYPEYYLNSTIYVMFIDKNGNKIGFNDRIKITEPGWHGISLSFSKLKETENETGIPFDYSNITEAGYSLFSVDGTECAAKAAVDYFIVTTGKPLFNVYN